MGSRTLACTLSLVLSTLPLAVRAQERAGPPAPPVAEAAATVAQARALFERAVAALRESHHDEACRLLERALRLREAPSIRQNLAVCHRALGHLVEAREHLLAFARTAPDPEAPEVTAARAEADRLARSAAAVTVVVPRRPRGLRVTLSGAPLPEAAFDAPRPIDPGHYVVEASAPGFLPFRSELDADSGGALTVRVALVRNPRVAAEEWISARRARAAEPLGRSGERETGTPITERWWFWTGIGVVAAGVAVGAAAAIAGSAGGSERPPPGFSGVIETSGR